MMSTLLRRSPKLLPNRVLPQPQPLLHRLLLLLPPLQFLRPRLLLLLDLLPLSKMLLSLQLMCLDHWLLRN